MSSWDDMLEPVDVATVDNGRSEPNTTPETSTEPNGRKDSASRSTPNQATEIVQMARARYNVVRGDDGKSYAVAHDLPGIAFAMRGSGGLRQQLAAAYFNDRNRAASGAALQDALAVLEGDAMRGPETVVHLRTGRRGSDIILDRANAQGHAIKVTSTGWRLIERAPILFRRTAVSMVMVAPEKAGSLDHLRSLLNVDERRFRLIVGYIIAAWLPDIAHPILALMGEQGVAKTSAARIILDLIDPSAASLVSQPRTADDWAVTAYNTYAVGLDNVSRMHPWLQDALCKAVTGDAFVRRELYSDDSVSVLRFRRPIALTTIDPGSLQGDVADRLLPIELRRILPHERRTESELAEEIAANRGSILGALLDILARVLAALPSINLTEKPRMADFAMVLAALDQSEDWDTLDDYIAATQSAARDVVDGDSFATALVDLVNRHGYWEGTCLELLTRLAPDSPPRGWPETPRGTAGRLSRLTPALLASNVEVERREERTRRGAVYILRLSNAPKCRGCQRPLPEHLSASGTTLHPTCTPPIDEEPF